MSKQINISINPLNDKVVVRPAVPPQQNAAGLYIPAQKSQARGTIVATGPGHYEIVGNIRKHRELQVKVGDNVIYQEYAGTKIQEGGEEFLILSESEILATVK
jgi:chaperonin GroES